MLVLYGFRSKLVSNLESEDSPTGHSYHNVGEGRHLYLGHQAPQKLVIYLFDILDAQAIHLWNSTVIPPSVAIPQHKDPIETVTQKPTTTHEHVASSEKEPNNLIKMIIIRQNPPSQLT